VSVSGVKAVAVPRGCRDEGPEFVGGEFVDPEFVGAKNDAFAFVGGAVAIAGVGRWGQRRGRGGEGGGERGRGGGGRGGGEGGERAERHAVTGRARRPFRESERTSERARGRRKGDKSAGGREAHLRYAKVSKETYLHGQRGLFICQKRPIESRVASSRAVLALLRYA